MNRAMKIKGLPAQGGIAKGCFYTGMIAQQTAAMGEPHQGSMNYVMVKPDSISFNSSISACELLWNAALQLLKGMNDVNIQRIVTWRVVHERRIYPHLWP